MSKNHRYGGIAQGADWERRRAMVFERDGRRCQNCGAAGRLEAHHITPISEGGTNDLDNLTTLCRSCHIDAHRRKVSEPELAWQQFVAETRRV